jgi:hypothetical protein
MEPPEFWVSAENQLLFATSGQSDAENYLPRERLVNLIDKAASEYLIEFPGDHLQNRQIQFGAPLRSAKASRIILC